MTPRKRILVVEDDASIAAPVQYALEQCGYEVLLAGDGTAGLMRVERDAPDLIVLDVVMPRRSGFAVLKRLECVRRPLPVILMTAGDGARHRALAASRGVDTFLAKPFAMSELTDAVDRLLQPTAPII
ncbi:MAG: response regulator transcription factor [Planctomycetes bacterium]|nr:response regulator transcription factor [Planctomycetota bacterium]